MAALSYGDAVSNDALAIQALLRAAGYESDIFAEHAHPRMSHHCRRLWEYAEVSTPDTVCLFHFAIGSGAGRLIFRAPDRLVVRYHNITPPGFFAAFLPHLARQCHQGRLELRAFAARTELALGVSEFNRRELEAAGFSRTGVLPLPLDLERFPSGPRSPVVRRLFADGRTRAGLRRGRGRGDARRGGRPREGQGAGGRGRAGARPGHGRGPAKVSAGRPDTPPVPRACDGRAREPARPTPAVGRLISTSRSSRRTGCWACSRACPPG